MIRWGDYIRMLKADGVTLETADSELMNAEGNSFGAQFLIRWVDGVPLNTLVEVPDMQEPVSRRTLRQVANALRLPPEKYIFPEEMN
ncbi:MAG: hypothetical protein AAF085_02060 [Planctomycetota bacterium]